MAQLGQGKIGSGVSQMSITSSEVMNLFKELDPILHSQLRLAIISLLMREKEADFAVLKDRTEATAGNLSVQINKLREAGYIDVTKEYKDNYPHTICKITGAGTKAFELYVKSLQSYLTVNGKR
jgi:DNA-binding transcriptional ArsR family regulator